VDTGLLIVRLVVGLVVAAHGLQILFGKFDGLGLQTSAAAFDEIGYRPGKLFATTAGLSESSGGLLLAAGLLTPLAAAAIVSAMFAAALSSHLKNGFWITNGGYEYTLTLASWQWALALSALAATAWTTCLGGPSVEYGGV
jgi:putative oxidoreductase